MTNEMTLIENSKTNKNCISNCSLTINEKIYIIFQDHRRGLRHPSLQSLLRK